MIARPGAPKLNRRHPSSMGRVPFTVAALLGAFLVAGFPPLTAERALGRGLSPVETAMGLRRLTMSLNPELLEGVHLEATEKWLPDGSHTPEVERDAVHFHRSVPVEVQQTENRHPLAANN